MRGERGEMGRKKKRKGESTRPYHRRKGENGLTEAMQRGGRIKGGRKKGRINKKRGRKGKDKGKTDER